MNTKSRTKSAKTISRSLLTGLVATVLIGFAASIGLSWILQTRLSNRSAEEVLRINIADVQQDIRDKSDMNLLELTREIAGELPEGQAATSERLRELMKQHDVSEINVINDHGFITASTEDAFLGYDMREGEQASEFMCLVTGSETEYVQKFRGISYDSSMGRKYAGVRFEGGGFVEVGYDAQRFQRDVDRTVVGITHNRHVGKGGFIMVADAKWNLVSDLKRHEGQNLYVSGVWIDREKMPENHIFHCTVYGVPSCCLYAMAEGYCIVAVIPENEIVLQRDTSVLLSSALEINIYIALFVVIFLLVRKLVVRNINRVNDSLSRITEGNLDEVVDVRSNTEFSALSDDINATVSTLKQYIKAAATRIDEELAFARNIQQSAMPSVFPPYPDRKVFSLYATMHAAREVGGDFYDFYLLDEDKLAFLIADVSGKGIPAAMFMMTGKTVIRDYAERGDAPAEVFRSANEKLCDGNDAGIFITAWMGFLNTKSGLVRFVNAGHNPPILIRDGRAAFISMEADLMLAGMERTAYEEQRLQMNPGDILFLYTDGVTEAANEQEEMFGEERLLEVLSASFGKGEEACRKICGALKQEIDRFTDGAAQSDDITMLCLYYAGGEEQRDHHAEEMRLEEAGVKQADEVAAFVERFLERENCPQEIRKEIEMAAEEIYVNIAGYAYAPGTGPAVIRIEMQEEPRGVAITFTDRGKPFNPLEKEDPDLTLSAKERPVGGLGIYMARNCMDDAAYEYADDQNILKLFRKF